jgi:putative tryptophan/tyrosine transport system substrate-binding protein
MRRRDLIVYLGGAVGWPLRAWAQTGKLPTIGFLGANNPSIQSQWTAAFVQRLHELSWVEGRTVAIEYRWAEGHFDRSPQMLADFVRLKVDVIVTHGTANVVAAKQTTFVIPIVFAAVSDPVGTNLVVSLGRPGGNITGLSNEAPDLAGKRLELLREIIPAIGRLVVLANVDNPAEVSDVQTAARALDLTITILGVRTSEDIAAGIAGLNGRADAIYVQSDPLFNFNRVQINALAQSARLPTVAGFRQFAEAGGLISYGPNFPDLFRRAAEYVDKILRGTKAGELPVEQPTKFDLVFNLTTAKALGFTIPPILLARADEVIE